MIGFYQRISGLKAWNNPEHAKKHEYYHPAFGREIKDFQIGTQVCFLFALFARIFNSRPTTANGSVLGRCGEVCPFVTTIWHSLSDFISVYL